MVRRGRALALASAAVAVLGTSLAAGCGSNTPAASSSPSGLAAPTSPATSPSGSSATKPAVGCDGGTWRAAPITVTHQIPVPPVPVIKDVRVAQHPECGYDRVVMDVGGAVPGYSVRYVTEVIADASGRTIALPGSRFLLITLRPAQAHRGTGEPTVTTGVRQVNYPALVSWAPAGDFEGVVKIALGLSGQASVRTGELPGRIYVDVRE